MLEFVSGNIFVREMALLKKGHVISGHVHAFDHTTYVVRGAIRIEILGPDGEVQQASDKRAIDGRNWALIRAGAIHRITALEDNTTAHCIYAHRSPQGDIVQEWTGWEAATL